MNSASRKARCRRTGGAIRSIALLTVQVLVALAAWAVAPQVCMGQEPTATIGHVPPASAPPGEPLVLSFRVTAAGALKQAVVYWRELSGAAWHPAPIQLSSVGKWEAEIPASAMDDPGIAYYITAVSVAGDVSQVFASPDLPHPVLVRGSPMTVLEREHLAALGGHRSELQVGAAYYDYVVAGVSKGKPNSGPRFYEASLRYRFWVLNNVEYFELGVSRIDGRGDDAQGPLANPAGVPTGFLHGWAQLGIRPHEKFGVSGRLVIGADESGFRMGGAAIFRIGSPLATHLRMDVGATLGVGWHVLTGLHLTTLPKLPVDFEAIITNEPDNSYRTGEMVRLRVGRQFTPMFLAGLLASYQAREGPDHGVGGGAEMRWTF